MAYQKVSGCDLVGTSLVSCACICLGHRSVIKIPRGNFLLVTLE